MFFFIKNVWESKDYQEENDTVIRVISVDCYLFFVVGTHTFGREIYFRHLIFLFAIITEASLRSQLSDELTTSEDENSSEISILK